MAIDLVGVFDDQRVATSAVDQLRQLGIDQKDIQVHTGASGAPMGRHSREHHGLFSRLFGREQLGELSGHLAEATRRGCSVVTVHVDREDRADQAERILKDAGAIDMDDRVNTWRTSGYSGYSADAEDYTPEQVARERETLQVLQEDLRVGKREVETGGVRVHRRVSETPVHEQVSLREEHAVVDRRPVDRIASPEELRGFDAGDRDIEIREAHEEAIVDKQARVVEEVTVGRESSEHVEQIDDTVRRTDVDVERLDAAQQGMLNRDATRQRPQPGL